MQYRELGRTGEKISVIGAGTWAAGGVNWGGTDDAKTTEAFNRALDLGVNLIDTAPIYGFGHSERVLGPIVKAHRSSIFLATKFGLVWEGDQPTSATNNLRPESIRAECDASLGRLQTDRIDLYQAHWPLPGDLMTRTVAEDMMAELHGLQAAGKVRHLGVSNFTLGQMDWCGGGKGLASDQLPLSILRPGAARELMPYCKDQGMGVLCYSPLFRGLLTGKYKGDETFPESDSRAKHADYAGEPFRKICAAAQELKRYADKYDSTISGVAINWVLSAPGATSALVGLRQKMHIEQAITGQGWSLSTGEQCEISDIFKPVAKVLL